jgi:hypothetical protein
MRYAVSKLRDPLGHSRASARPSSPANLKRERPKSDKRPGVEKRINKKQASDTDKRRGLRDALSQTPIRATLIGSNCCEALGITARGRTPVLDLCRALLKAGHDPRRPLHAYRATSWRSGSALSVKAPSSPSRRTVPDPVSSRGSRFRAGSGRGCAKEQKGSVVPLTGPTNPARRPAQPFEPQRNPSPTLTAVRAGAHDEQAQETIRQNGAPAARDRADHQTSL